MNNFFGFDVFSLSTSGNILRGSVDKSIIATDSLKKSNNYTLPTSARKSDCIIAHLHLTSVCYKSVINLLLFLQSTYESRKA